MELNTTALILPIRPAETSTSTDHEPYILTLDEETEAITHAVERAKNHYRYKHEVLNYGKNEIEAKIAAINWEVDMIQREDVLKAANSNKIYKEWEREQRENEKKRIAENLAILKEKWTAKEMFNEMAKTSFNVYGKKLLITEHNRHLITTLCFFVSREMRFETELGYSLQKGLLIRGVSGLGKTHLVKCLENNELNPIAVLSMLEIADQIRSEGEAKMKIENQTIIYLDDVGTEEATVKHFGTPITFFKDFIENQYMKRKSFSHLIISTNNSFDEIESKYGFRVRSRIKEMFNIVDVKGEDLRK